ncbi:MULTISPECIES: polysaccharide deacetylase family protein [unclassified Streptomyces]|uniref:polysaccharide deacetylase family protein n=1 Tax=unclassified Streptomyces TaxID=2593676 RepID=UPI000690DBDF|nr:MULTISPECIES: polysaccharide deacetylase family protein [unclassified Streptomyces]
MRITTSSARRRRAGYGAAAALLGLLAAAGTPAYAATDGSVDRTPDAPPGGHSAQAGTAGAAQGAAQGAAHGAAQGAAHEAAQGTAHGSAGVPLGISRLAQGAGRQVAITIDDGPDPRWTPQVLETLRKNHVKATFCMIGTKAQKYPELARAVAADGHQLCDHSVDHDVTMDHKPVAYQRQQILDGKAMIEKAVPGVPVTYYRAPGGAFTPDSRAIAAASGMRPLGWSVDPKDWSRPGLKAILSTVQGKLPQQPTVLFHDGGGDRSETVAALKEYLPWLTEQGYSFSFPARTTP